MEVLMDDDGLRQQSLNFRESTKLKKGQKVGQVLDRSYINSTLNLTRHHMFNISRPKPHRPSQEYTKMPDINIQRAV